MRRFTDMFRVVGMKGRKIFTMHSMMRLKIMG